MEAVIKITTESGFIFDYNRGIEEEWDFFELMLKLQNGDLTVLKEIACYILGVEGFEKMKAHLKELNGGRLTTASVFAEITDILNSIDNLKN